MKMTSKLFFGLTSVLLFSIAYSSIPLPVMAEEEEGFIAVYPDSCCSNTHHKIPTNGLISFYVSGCAKEFLSDVENYHPVLKSENHTVELSLKKFNPDEDDGSFVWIPKTELRPNTRYRMAWGKDVELNECLQKMDGLRDLLFEDEGSEQEYWDTTDQRDDTPPQWLGKPQVECVKTTLSSPPDAKPYTSAHFKLLTSEETFYALAEVVKEDGSSYYIDDRVSDGSLNFYCCNDCPIGICEVGELITVWVTAIDLAGNESPAKSPLEFRIPKPAPDPVDLREYKTDISFYPPIETTSETMVKTPVIALKVKLEGNVDLSLVIDQEGKVKDVKVLQGLPMGITEYAVESVKEWTFVRSEKDKPRKTDIRIKYEVVEHPQVLPDWSP